MIETGQPCSHGEGGAEPRVEDARHGVAKVQLAPLSQFRGDEIRPETQRAMVQGDPHPIAKFRVIGPLSNMPEFATAFGCKQDALMVRPQEKRCEVW